MGKNNINKFVDIVLPTEAADSYYMNKNKHYIDDFIFIEQEWYDKLFDSNIFYILGAKGSGKTLYAAYMCAEKEEIQNQKHIQLTWGLWQIDCNEDFQSFRLYCIFNNVEGYSHTKISLRY